MLGSSFRSDEVAALPARQSSVFDHDRPPSSEVDDVPEGPQGKAGQVDGGNPRFDFEIDHAPDTALSVPDCLSRDAVEPDEDGLPRVAAFLHSQEEELGDLDDFVLFTEDHFQDEDGQMCVSQKCECRVVVPESLPHAVFDYVHGAVSTGHFGVAKTYSRAAERFWWPAVAKDVQ